jgi:hypothetical protein
MQTDVVGPMKDAMKRKYQEDFIKFGLTSMLVNGDGMLQCVICCEVLADKSRNANKLMRRLKTKHGFFR